MPLRGRETISRNSTTASGKRSLACDEDHGGGRRWFRTNDLQLVELALSQLS